MEKLNTDILTEIAALNRKIDEKYPELRKYLDETRSTIPQSDVNNPNIDTDALQNYRDSLKELIKKYNH